jgi:hypothetical protein
MCPLAVGDVAKRGEVSASSGGAPRKRRSRLRRRRPSTALLVLVPCEAAAHLSKRALKGRSPSYGRMAATRWARSAAASANRFSSTEPSVVLERCDGMGVAEVSPLSLGPATTNGRSATPERAEAKGLCPIEALFCSSLMRGSSLL